MLLSKQKSHYENQKLILSIKANDQMIFYKHAKFNNNPIIESSFTETEEEYRVVRERYMIKGGQSIAMVDLENK